MSKVKLYDRIGEVFTLKSGHTLTIIGVSDEKIGRSSKHIVECSYCSSDKELFPDPFTILYNKLLVGQSPCGCGRYVYDERQIRLKIKRKSKVLGHKFIGFSGEFVSSKVTTPTIYCKHGEKIRGSCHHYLNYVKYGCNTCSGEEIRKDILDTISVPECVSNLVIMDSENDTNIIYYRCEVCSDDWFVKSNYCNGWFKIKPSRLNLGKLSCRCSGKFFGDSNYKLGRAVLGQEYNLTTTVLSLGEEHRGRERINIHCSIHGDTIQDASSCYEGFLPKCCAQTGWYVRKGQEDEVDFLYVVRLVSDGEILIKIGRSFDVPTRMNQLEELYQTDLLYVLTSTHEEICKYERLYHKVFRPYREYPSMSFKGDSEIFSEEILNLQDFKLLIVDLVNGY